MLFRSDFIENQGFAVLFIFMIYLIIILYNWEDGRIIPERIAGFIDFVKGYYG